MELIVHCLYMAVASYLAIFQATCLLLSIQTIDVGLQYTDMDWTR